jgi:hypothetical protein
VKPKYDVVFNLNIRKNNDCTLRGAGEHTELRMNDNNDPEPNSLNSYRIEIISLVVSLASRSYSVFFGGLPLLLSPFSL